MRRYVVDASVVAKWYFPEEHSASAVSLFGASHRGEVSLLAPDLLLIEIGSLVLRKVRSASITQGEGGKALRSLPLLPIHYVATSPLSAEALVVASDVGLSFYDALYLVAARDTTCPLITADRVLVRKARNNGMSALVMTLGDMPA